MKRLKQLGPGIVIAATGIGAGDMVAAAVSGAKYGTVIIWAALLGAVLKYVLNEGIARWQLATGMTLIEGWKEKFHQAVSIYFMAYLFLWGFIVAGALISACGLAAHAIFPFWSVEIWGILHSLLALSLVYFGRYGLIEILMKVFIVLLFLVVCISAVLSSPDWGTILKSSLIPRVPRGSAKFILGVIGGVGGSVTLLSYGYWIREKNWAGRDYARQVGLDLRVAYLLTGLFGMAIMIISAGIQPAVITGNKMVLGLADKLGTAAGPAGKVIFLTGFWGAVFSSMLGVWQGVPYLFTDMMTQYKNRGSIPAEKEIQVRSGKYILFLLYLSLPPMLLLFLGKPVWVVVIYSIVGAFFMPFLAVLLLVMNNRFRWVKDFKNSLSINILLWLALLLFAFLCLKELAKNF